VWGAVVIPEHEFAKIPINSGIKLIHASDAKPPYGIFLKDLDSGHEIAVKETWDPVPAPPGRYRLDWWESQHGSTRQTLADEFTIEPGALVEVEM
jgi:Ca-activated chloride channel family protein